ncbi:hypothetical protein SAMN06295920_110127 [Rhizorhabdus histidinilytica]|uniref:DNA-binding protein n=1 Tax=Rhizorhabdus histidinilytica TaxID=439228 RepID=A0A1T5FQ15_9SPHN|nr:hypothetical protein SAMN06295920_110127 [Rhizorhabdus histidinilytica]
MSRKRKAAPSVAGPVDYERACKELTKVLARLTKGGNGEPSKQVYFDEVWLADRWNVSEKLIQKMRYDATGPQVTRFGTAVRYRLRDIVAFEKSSREMPAISEEIIA